VKFMEPVLELAITLPPPGSRARLSALHRQLRAGILDGRLRAGLRLPPTRALAAALGVARNTTIAAYDMLLSEGYVVARAGAGTYVADVPTARAKPAAAAARIDRLAPAWRAPAPLIAATPPRRFDFRIGLPDKGPFPFAVWRRLSARALRALSRAPAGYAEPEGRPRLREAIARHVSFTRAVACRADEIVVTAGAQQAFDLLARILVIPGRTLVAVEEPGYPPLRAAFAAAGAGITGVPVDGEGMVVDQIPPRARVICVTPSHQFPLGSAMSAARRAALLDLARRREAVVIEDDYDSEFRFAGRPLDALRTLDRDGAVLYVGTFSKSLFPALRLGFVVAPQWARPALVAAKQRMDWHAPVLAQDTLAAFIVEGHLARHIRKMRRIYAARREGLLAALARHCGDRLTPIPAAAGLHLAARLSAPLRAGAVAARAAQADVAIEPLARYGAARPVNGLAFGLGMIATDRIDEAIRRLSRAMQ